MLERTPQRGKRVWPQKKPHIAIPVRSLRKKHRVYADESGNVYRVVPRHLLQFELRAGPNRDRQFRQFTKKIERGQSIGLSEERELTHETNAFLNSYRGTRLEAPASALFASKTQSDRSTIRPLQPTMPATKKKRKTTKTTKTNRGSRFDQRRLSRQSPSRGTEHVRKR